MDSSGSTPSADPHLQPVESSDSKAPPLNYGRTTTLNTLHALLPVSVGLALIIIGVTTLLVTLGIVYGGSASRRDNFAGPAAMACLFAGVGLGVCGALILFRALNNFISFR